MSQEKTPDKNNPSTTDPAKTDEKNLQGDLTDEELKSVVGGAVIGNIRLQGGLGRR